LSWSPSRVGLPLRAYLRPVPVSAPLNSSDITLEQIILAPAQVHQSHCGCDLVGTMWNVAGDVVPAAYLTGGMDWSNSGHVAALSSAPIHIDPTLVPYNPGETRIAMQTHDKYLLDAIVGIQSKESLIWTATGMPHNTVDLEYLSRQILVFLRNHFYLLSFRLYFYNACSIREDL
jgi:hypothetical protein